MRLATWNLKSCPAPQGERGQRISKLLEHDGDSIALLTEVHANWGTGSPHSSLSPERSGYEKQHRLAGVFSSLPHDQLETPSDHVAEEEALCLVRVKIPDSATQSVLVACSVMPWRGAAKWWSGLEEASDGAGLAPQFSAVLQHHVSRIMAHRRRDEPVIWGGDFNQELSGPITAGTIQGRADLADAFKQLGLEVLTENSRHLDRSLSSIDHIAVSPGWRTWGTLAVHGEQGTHFPSDHALYEIETV